MDFFVDELFCGYQSISTFYLTLFLLISTYQHTLYPVAPGCPDPRFGLPCLAVMMLTDWATNPTKSSCVVCYMLHQRTTTPPLIETLEHWHHIFFRCQISDVCLFVSVLDESPILVYMLTKPNQVKLLSRVWTTCSISPVCECVTETEICLTFYAGLND